MFSEELVMSRYYCNNGSPYFPWGLIYYIINQGKSKPFLRVSQALLNGRLLQSVTADCTVRYGGLYGSLQQTIQSIAEDCSNPTYIQA